jgi:hypothetical protein
MGDGSVVVYALIGTGGNSSSIQRGSKAAIIYLEKLLSKKCLPKSDLLS